MDVAAQPTKEDAVGADDRAFRQDPFSSAKGVYDVNS